MRRFFVKNLFFVLAVNLLVKPIWVFMIDRTVQNRVGHEAYGTYQPLLNICIIFQILLDFGLNNYNTNLVSQNPGRIKTLFPAMLTTRLVLTAVYSAVVLTAGFISGYRGWELTLLCGVLMIQALSSLVLYLRSNVAALHRFKIDGILSVTDRLLMIGLCGFLLFSPLTANDFRIEWFVAAQVVCYALTAIIGFAALYRIAHVRPSLSFDVSEIKALVKKSIPYALLVFLMGIHMRFDMVLVERIAGKNEAGIYASAYRLLDVSNMFGLLFAGILLPLFGKMLVEKQNVQSIIKLSVNLLMPFAFTLLVAAFFFGTEIMHLLYKDAGMYEGDVFGWLMATFPAFCIMYVYSTLLTANGDIALMNKISVAGVVISIGLNMVLIPMHGAVGAAYTTCITQSILAVCYILFSSRELQLPRNTKWIAAHAGFLMLLFAVAFATKLMPTNWMVQLATFGMISMAGMVAFRFISPEGLKLFAQKG